MRLRRNRMGEAMLPEMPGVLPPDPDAGRKDLAAFLDGGYPVHLEIGAGKGDFIVEMAVLHRDTGFIAVERALTVLYAAAGKNQDSPLPNLRFLPADARDLELYFAPGSLERIYLNFSDPWPKQRHRERRLTDAGMLAIYSRLLKPGGQIHLKTDQEAFFDYSLGLLIRDGWSVGKITRDLHRSGFEGNVFTEYERRFLRQGQAIYRLEAWNDRRGKARRPWAEG